MYRRLQRSRDYLFKKRLLPIVLHQVFGDQLDERDVVRTIKPCLTAVACPVVGEIQHSRIFDDNAVIRQIEIGPQPVVAPGSRVVYGQSWFVLVSDSVGIEYLADRFFPA